MRRLAVPALAACLVAVSPPVLSSSTLDVVTPLVLHDTARNRDITVDLYLPVDAKRCTSIRPCPAAMLSHGSGISPRDYSFIAAYLTAQGYAVASIGHSLPSDPKMDPAGDLAQQRRDAWTRGADNIRYVRRALAESESRFDWSNVVLIGHSLGGDSSAAYASEPEARVRAVITLDNRRAALPRVTSTRVLSLRASDTEADYGVLPTPDEQRKFNICIVKIAGSRHNDMEDAGSAELKGKIVASITTFLQDDAHAKCPAG
jgi:predicted dienelactone hydrolase